MTLHQINKRLDNFQPQASTTVSPSVIGINHDKLTKEVVESVFGNPNTRISYFESNAITDGFDSEINATLIGVLNCITQKIRNDLPHSKVVSQEVVVGGQVFRIGVQIQAFRSGHGLH